MYNFISIGSGVLDPRGVEFPTLQLTVRTALTTVLRTNVLHCDHFRDTGLKSQCSHTLPAFNGPIRGCPSIVILSYGLVRKKLEWCGYPTAKEVWEYVYSFWHNTWTWQTDGHPPHDSVAQQKLRATHNISILRQYIMSMLTVWRQLSEFSSLAKLHAIHAVIRYDVMSW